MICSSRSSQAFPRYPVFGYGEGLKCAPKDSLPIGLLAIDQVLLGITVAFSAYSSYLDWRTLTYPPTLALAMLWLGLVSTTLRSALAIRSLTFPLVFPLDLLFALTCPLFLKEMRVMAEGDLSYFYSLCLCFPRYPYRLVYSLSRYFQISTRVSCNTSLAWVLLVNSFLLTPHMLALRVIAKGRILPCLKALYVLFSVLGFVSMNLLMLVIAPLLLTHHLNEDSPSAEPFPMIPCLFVSLMASLTFGDLFLILS